MPYIQAPDRQQLTFMNKLDDLVAPDHPVRLLDALIDQIIAADAAFFDHLGAEGRPGRRGYRAGCLIKLFLYGYINGISSSRKLQAEAERNIEVIWLLSSLSPSYKVIADYRKDFPQQLQRVHEQVVRFLMDNNWIRGQRVAIDGTKLKAYTGWDMPDEEELAERLQRAHRQLDGWLDQLAANDALEDAAEERIEEGLSATEPEMMSQIDQLHRRIEKLEAARRRLANSEAKRLPLSDPQARPMRAAHGGKPPAYNLQASVDSDHKMIVAASVVNDGNDFEQLLPMHAHTAKRLGKAPCELLADTGYADLGDIKQIQTETRTRCYIPENDAPVKNRRVQFSYEPAADQYRCSVGRTLAPTAKGHYRRSKEAYVDTYRGTNCQGCPLGAECTSAADGVRQLTVFHGARWRHDYARQLSSRYGKARIAERKSIVEHVFGTLRYWMGQIPLKLRGLRKVQTEIDLYAAAYNLKRWMGMGTFNERMAEVTAWPAGRALRLP
jgi:transposase/TolA-binding protein